MAVNIFHKKCRLCLFDRGDMFEIFGEDCNVSTVYFHDKIFMCTNIKIEVGDGLPSVVCSSCHLYVESWYVFKEQCEKVDKSLREQLSLQKKQPSEEIQKDWTEKHTGICSLLDKREVSLAMRGEQLSEERLKESGLITRKENINNRQILQHEEDLDLLMRERRQQKHLKTYGKQKQVSPRVKTYGKQKQVSSRVQSTLEKKQDEIVFVSPEESLQLKEEVVIQKDPLQVQEEEDRQQNTLRQYQQLEKRKQKDLDTMMLRQQQQNKNKELNLNTQEQYSKQKCLNVVNINRLRSQKQLKKSELMINVQENANFQNMQEKTGEVTFVTPDDTLQIKRENVTFVAQEDPLQVTSSLQQYKHQKEAGIMAQNMQSKENEEEVTFPVQDDPLQERVAESLVHQLQVQKLSNEKENIILLKQECEVEEQEKSIIFMKQIDILPHEKENQVGLPDLVMQGEEAQDKLKKLNLIQNHQSEKKQEILISVPQTQKPIIFTTQKQQLPHKLQKHVSIMIMNLRSQEKLKEVCLTFKYREKQRRIIFVMKERQKAKQLNTNTQKEQSLENAAIFIIREQQLLRKLEEEVTLTMRNQQVEEILMQVNLKILYQNVSQEKQMEIIFKILEHETQDKQNKEAEVVLLTKNQQELRRRSEQDRYRETDGSFSGEHMWSSVSPEVSATRIQKNQQEIPKRKQKTVSKMHQKMGRRKKKKTVCSLMEKVLTDSLLANEDNVKEKVNVKELKEIFSNRFDSDNKMTKVKAEKINRVQEVTLKNLKYPAHIDLGHSKKNVTIEGTVNKKICYSKFSDINIVKHTSDSNIEKGHDKEVNYCNLKESINENEVKVVEMGDKQYLFDDNAETVKDKDEGNDQIVCNDVRQINGNDIIHIIEGEDSKRQTHSDPNLQDQNVDNYSYNGLKKVYHSKKRQTQNNVKQTVVNINTETSESALKCSHVSSVTPVKGSCIEKLLQGSHEDVEGKKAIYKTTQKSQSISKKTKNTNTKQHKLKHLHKDTHSMQDYVKCTENISLKESGNDLINYKENDILEMTGITKTVQQRELIKTHQVHLHSEKLKNEDITHRQNKRINIVNDDDSHMNNVCSIKNNFILVDQVGPNSLKQIQIKNVDGCQDCGVEEFQDVIIDQSNCDNDISNVTSDSNNLVKNQNKITDHTENNKVNSCQNVQTIDLECIDDSNAIEGNNKVINLGKRQNKNINHVENSNAGDSQNIQTNKVKCTDKVLHVEEVIHGKKQNIIRECEDDSKCSNQDLVQDDRSVNSVITLNGTPNPVNVLKKILTPFCSVTTKTGILPNNNNNTNSTSTVLTCTNQKDISKVLARATLPKESALVTHTQSNTVPKGSNKYSNSMEQNNISVNDDITISDSPYTSYLSRKIDKRYSMSVTSEITNSPNEHHKCIYCKREFFRKVDFQRHLCILSKNEILAINFGKKNTSDVCGNTIQNKISVNNDSNIKDHEASSSNTCDVRDKLRNDIRRKFNNNSNAAKHATSSGNTSDEHDNVRHVVKKYAKEKYLKELCSSNRPFLCLICGRRYRHKLQLSFHMVTHDISDGNMIPCPLCNKHFSSKRLLYKHSFYHREKTFSCEFCPAKFKLNSNLNSHKTAAHSDNSNRYLCHYCGKNFMTSSGFINHVNSYHEKKETRYECDVCKKTFEMRISMIYHSYIHSGVKPYACAHCPMSFYTKKYVRNHIQKKHDVKFSTCEICNEQYQYDYMKQHMECHKQTYICLICNKSFCRSQKLQRHLRTMKHTKNEAQNIFS